MNRIPTTLASGVTLDLLVTLTAHPAPDWVLRLHLRGAGAIDVASAPEGSQHRLRAAADQTAGWVPGRYAYTLRAARGAEVVEIEAGELVISPDVAAAAAGFDGRSHARRVLDAIEAVLEKRATQDQEKYRINNRELWRTPIADLLVLRDRYRAELRREQARQQGRSLFGAAVRVRF